MVIWRSFRPRGFKKKTGKELGFDFHANKKAWMTTALFFNWLQRFDNYVGNQEGRRVALLIDNCSAHGSIETLPVLYNVDVIFLPPKTTSKLQPLDTGIIVALKLRYRRA